MILLEFFKKLFYRNDTKKTIEVTSTSVKTVLLDSERCPQKGDVYVAKQDQKVMCMTQWLAPFTGGGESQLFKDEVIYLDTDPYSRTPQTVYAIPFDYENIEQRMVPNEHLSSEEYAGFCLCIDANALKENFELIQTKYEPE